MTLSEKNLECLLVLNFDTLRFLITTEKENENHKNLNFFLGSFLYPPPSNILKGNFENNFKLDRNIFSVQA